MSGVQRTMEQTRDWEAWTGTVQDIDRLVTVIDAAFRQRKATIVQGFSDQVLPRTAAELKVLSEHDVSFGTDDRKVEAVRASKLIMAVADRLSVAEGPVEEVASEIDRRTTVDLSISAEFGGGYFSPERLSVSFDKDDVRYGVRLHVKSRDAGWARQVLSAVSDEIDKGKPRWAWVRSSTGSAMIVGLISMIASISTVLFLAGLATPDANATFMVPIVIGACSALGYYRVQDWIFPRFELIGEGGSSTGSRRLGLIIVAVASIPIGILVNVISS